MRLIEIIENTKGSIFGGGSGFMLVKDGEVIEANQYVKAKLVSQWTPHNWFETSYYRILARDVVPFLYSETVEKIIPVKDGKDIKILSLEIRLNSNYVNKVEVEDIYAYYKEQYDICNAESREFSYEVSFSHSFIDDLFHLTPENMEKELNTYGYDKHGKLLNTIA